MLPMSVLAGAGVYWLVNLWSRAVQSWLKRPKTIMMVMGVGIILALSIQNLDYDFREHPRQYMNDTWSTRWRGDALVRATLQVIDKPEARVFWVHDSDIEYVADSRFYETYIFLRGEEDFISMNDPINEAWVAGLSTNRNLYIFIAPQVDDPLEAELPAAPSSPVWWLMSAYPGAELYRYDMDGYPVDMHYSLYSMVYIPKGTQYCSPGCRSEKFITQSGG